METGEDSVIFDRLNFERSLNELSFIYLVSAKALTLNTVNNNIITFFISYSEYNIVII